MTRSSPGVRRIAAILDFMADHPGQTFALTDLVRALKLSRATCHALLTGLVEVGYLYRTSDKTYVLGPALAKIGRAAAQHFSPLQVAQPEMRALADEFDVVCSAVKREGATAVVRERAASVSHVGYSVPLGARLRLHTAFVGIHFAWVADGVGEWLKVADPVPTEAELEDMRRGMAFVREYGFQALVRNPTAPGNDRTEQFFGGEALDTPILLATAIEPDGRYDLTSLVAPVFAADGRIEFVMGLMGFNRVMSGTELFAAADKLKAACARIGAFIAGGPAIAA